MVNLTYYGHNNLYIHNNNFCSKFEINSSQKIYNTIIKNIPLQMIRLIREQVKYTVANPMSLG